MFWPNASFVDGYLIQITTTDGRMMISNSAIAPGEKVGIDLSGKPHGVYLLFIHEGEPISISYYPRVQKTDSTKTTFLHSQISIQSGRNWPFQ